MRIVIIGAGISGCSAYLALRKHLPQPPAPSEPHSYTIYEAYDTNRDTSFRERPPATPGDDDPRSATLVVGGGLGIGPNGLAVVKRLDESLLEAMMRSGYAYSKLLVKSSYGWTLMASPATAKINGRESNSLGVGRHSAWQCLRDRIPDDVIINRKIERVVPNGSADGKRHLILFADGSEAVEADLVIGSDGLKSTVKRAIFNAETVEKDPYPPEFEGIVGVGGFVPVTPTMLNNIPEGSLTITFGGTGSFGYVYTSSSPSDTHRSSEYHLSAPGSTLTWWSSYGMTSSPDVKNVDCAAITADLRARHGNWSDPVIREIIENVQVQTIWPVWTTAELPVWDRDGIVLLGDAAHALPPTSGQGAAQALEDSESFTLFLAHYLGRAYSGSSRQELSEREAVQLAAKKHRELRYPRVKTLLEQARQRNRTKQEMNIAMEFFMYFFVWMMGLLGSSSSKPVLEYNIADEVQKVIVADTADEVSPS